MHAGKLWTKSAAGRVWRCLLENLDDWKSGWELTALARTTAVSTRISEVRAQLPDGYALDTKQEGRGFWYRLRRVGA